MGVIVVIIITTTGFINSWLNNERITPITASVSYSAKELLAENQNYVYEFNYENYYIYWFFSATLPNGTFLPTSYLKNYFTYKINYISETATLEELATEPCKTDQMDIFLGLNEDIVNGDIGKIGINRICIKDSVKMGLFPNNDVANVFQPEIYFSLYQCVNTTENNNSCAPQAEIDEMIKYTTVQTTIPNTIYDFSNSKKAQKNTYNYFYTKLDKSMLKYYQNMIKTTTLFIDDGIIYENYRALAVNFNPEINYDPSIRSGNDPLFVFDCMVDFRFQMYYLRNQKLNEIAGNLGGLVNTIFLLGKLLCMTYNSIYLRFKIISSTFSSTKNDKKANLIFPKGVPEPTTMVTSKNSSINANIVKSFSYCSYLFPSKDVRRFYQSGYKHLHEYLDIRKIIKRLQDLDKLKMVLLNEDQRSVFECLPKPDVIDARNKLSMESINKYRKSVKTRKLTKNISNTMKSMAEDNDPVNKRILECLESKAIKHQEIDNNGYFLLFFS